MEFYLKELFEPEQLVKNSKDEGHVPALINYLIIPVIALILAGLGFGAFMAIFGDVGAGIMSMIGLPVVGIIGWIFAVVIINVIIFIGAKILGSNTSFSEQMYKLSIIFLPASVILLGLYILQGIGMLLSAILIGIPILLILLVIEFVFAIFLVYTTWAVLKEIHQFDNMQLIKSMTISLCIIGIVIAIILVIAFIVVGALAMTAISAMTGAGMMPPMM
jgi:hypothetical protein